MRVRCESLLGDADYKAELREVPSMTSRDGTELVLVVYAGTDVELSAPAPVDCLLVQATADEIADLKAAGYDLQPCPNPRS
jgi:hypothetical protein